MRYLVSENQFGYELHSGVLRYAVIDTQPDMVSTYSPIQRCRVLTPIGQVSAILRESTKLRQVAFCLHREDAEALAASMNARDRVLA
jgi:hypothetical protein